MDGVWGPITAADALDATSGWARGNLLMALAQGSFPTLVYYLDLLPGDPGQTEILAIVDTIGDHWPLYDDAEDAQARVAMWATVGPDLERLDRDAAIAELADSPDPDEAAANVDEAFERIADWRASVKQFDPTPAETARQHHRDLATEAGVAEVVRSVFATARFTADEAGQAELRRQLAPAMTKAIRDNFDTLGEQPLRTLALDPRYRVLAALWGFLHRTGVSELASGRLCAGERAQVLHELLGPSDLSLVAPSGQPEAFPEGSWTSVMGTVASVTDNGDGTSTLTFAETTGQIHNCLQWGQSDEIERVLLDGTVQYKSVCLDFEVVDVVTTPEPLVVGHDLCGGIEPGRFVTVRLAEDAPAIPQVVRASSDPASEVFARLGVTRG